MATVDILLSTYNGERFLPEQLDSLLAQDDGDWRLIIRDDGSKDSTVDILRAFINEHPDKAVLIDNGGVNLGASRSFSALLEVSDAPFSMFCDQDDVWLPHKVSRTLERMRTIEAEHGDAMPVMVHSDLRVVDQQLETIAESFCKQGGLVPTNSGRLNAELVMNVVTGCTIMLNRAARLLVLPVPREAIMHDWWIALAVAAFGRASFIDEALILYRQHGANVLGAREYSLRALYRSWQEKRIYRRKHEAEGNRSLFIHYNQAKTFLDHYRDRLTPQTRATVQAYLDMYVAGPLVRFYYMWRYGLWKSGFLRNLSFGTARINRQALLPEYLRRT